MIPGINCYSSLCKQAKSAAMDGLLDSYSSLSNLRLPCFLPEHVPTTKMFGENVGEREYNAQGDRSLMKVRIPENHLTGDL